MPDIKLMSPTSLYGALNILWGQTSAEHWLPAKKWSFDAVEEALRQQRAAAATDKHDWHEFLIFLNFLQLTIDAKDVEGCDEALANLRACLAKIVGPEPGAAV